MDFNKEQLLELTNILMKSKAVSYEPNARLLLHNEPAKEKYYVSDNDGHLTINYSQLAQDVFAADFRKQVQGEWIPHKQETRGVETLYYRRYQILEPLDWYCAICNHITEQPTHFCPNCGAKMKGNS